MKVHGLPWVRATPLRPGQNARYRQGDLQHQTPQQTPDLGYAQAVVRPRTRLKGARLSGPGGFLLAAGPGSRPVRHATGSGPTAPASCVESRSRHGRPRSRPVPCQLGPLQGPRDVPTGTRHRRQRGQVTVLRRAHHIVLPGGRVGAGTPEEQVTTPVGVCWCRQDTALPVILPRAFTSRPDMEPFQSRSCHRAYTSFTFQASISRPRGLRSGVRPAHSTNSDLPVQVRRWREWP